MAGHARTGFVRLGLSCLLVVLAGALSGSVVATEPPHEVVIACAVGPALVNIATTSAFDEDDGAAATGIVISSDGTVLTNNHVVVGAGKIDVTSINDGRSYSAAVLGTDIVDDLAVLRLSGARGLPSAALGDSSTIRIGQRVYALGNTHGTCMRPSIRSGTVSGLDRTTVAGHALNGDPLRLTGLIQTSAALDHGVSGGPLVTEAGEVVGILAAGFRASPGEYRGFAIPINRALTIATQIQVGRSSATVHVGPAASLGVQPSASIHLPKFVDGAVVRRVLPGSPADLAGVQPGCHIVELQGRPITSARALIDFLHARRPGEVIVLHWVDHLTGRDRTASVTLAPGPPL